MKPTIKHYPLRVGMNPVTYTCPCGHSSSDAKEFVSVSNPSAEKVTCEAALKYIFGSVKVEAK